MSENDEYSYISKNFTEIYNSNSENNIENGINRNDEHRNLILNNFISPNNKSESNENFDSGNNMNIQSNNDKQQFIEEAEYSNKNSNEIHLGDVYNNQNINDNKKTAITNNNNTINVNGKQINTNNEQIYITLNELYNVKEVNMETKHDMQLLKKKQKRRTRKEIDLEKQKEGEKKFENKAKGRKKKDEQSLIQSKHSKKSDDNIMKKINSFYLDRVREWLNNSFLDEKGFFETLKQRQKLKKPIFLKIKPQIIATNLKKKSAISTINETFKNILSNEISKKYSTLQKDENLKLVNKIYEEKNQPFVMCILDSTFIDILNYFSGQNNGENIKNYFKNMNISEQMIEEFLNKFQKIKTFLSKIDEKEKKDKNGKESQDYVERIGLLCINYKAWFEKKFERINKKK
jgi:hypothetical protein